MLSNAILSTHSIPCLDIKRPLLAKARGIARLYSITSSARASSDCGTLFETEVQSTPPWCPTKSSNEPAQSPERKGPPFSGQGMTPSPQCVFPLVQLGHQHERGSGT